MQYLIIFLAQSDIIWPHMTPLGPTWPHLLPQGDGSMWGLLYRREAVRQSPGPGQTHTATPHSLLALQPITLPRQDLIGYYTHISDLLKHERLAFPVPPPQPVNDKKRCPGFPRKW